MNRQYRNIGRETLEIAETAPLHLLQEILMFHEADSEQSIEIIWPVEDDDRTRGLVLEQLNRFDRDQLQPLEDRSVRIRRLAVDKGPTSLKHVTDEQLFHEQIQILANQPDDLCKSLWCYLRHPTAFADAEAFHAVRQYRDHRKMYDSFEVDPGDDAAIDGDTINDTVLASLLTTRLQLPSSAVIRTLNLPATETHAKSVLIIVRHAGPLSSVFHHKDNGLRATIYFRPPNEATLVWTPRDRVIEVCGPSPDVRKTVANTFAEVALKTDLSAKPLSWRYYDLTRFHRSLELPLPSFDGIDISVAKVIDVEMRLGSWARRLGLKVTIDDDIQAVADRWLGGRGLLTRVEGFSRVGVAVAYKRIDDGKPRSLNISFGDRRSNLQSKTESGERDLAYRLLQHWGILNRLTPLEYDEVIEILPHLLALHDLPDDIISGGQLRRLGLEPKRLLSAGIIEHRSRQARVLDDDGDEMVIEPVRDQVEAASTGLHGEEGGILPADDFRNYMIRRDWLEEILLTAFGPLFGKGAFEALSDDVVYLGRWRWRNAEIPIHFARRLGQPDRLQRSDEILRSRQALGIGIVFSAAQTPLKHLGPNVVVPLVDVLEKEGLDDDAKLRLFDRFTANRLNALGGTEVALFKFEHQIGMLYIPGMVPLAVSGAKKLDILERLVNAHKAGAPGVSTKSLVEGTGVGRPIDAWPLKTRSGIIDRYFESGGYGLWRLKVATTA